MDNNKDNPSAVSFYVYRKDGSSNPEIKKFFLDVRELTAIDAVQGHIRLSDNTIWELVLESPVVKALKAASAVKCVISFQARIQGNYAVARIYDDTKQSSKRKVKS